MLMTHGTRLGSVTLCAIAFFLAAPCLLAQGQQSQQGQQQGQQQSQQQQSNPPQQTQKPSLQNPQQNIPAPPPVDPKEEAAYKAFYDMKPATSADYDAQIQAGEAFLKDFPQSHYRESVYARLANAYLQKHDMDKAYDAADKALALNPDDVSVLIPVGSAIPRSASAPNFSQMLDKAEQYEKHALDVLSTMPKPAGATDEQFTQSKNEAIAEAHSGLGISYFRESKFDQSSAELAKATDGVSNPDPVDYLVLGLDLENLQKYPDSVKAFDSCAQITSPVQDRCKQGSTEVKAKEGAAPPHKP
jgi:tetratricopeptide (TPR) repeat protein